MFSINANYYVQTGTPGVNLLYPGLTDECLVFNRTWSALEVHDYYMGFVPLKNHASGSVFDETSLKAYWKLEDLTDSGPNGYTLSGAGTPTFVAAKYTNGMNLVTASSQQAYTATNILGATSCTVSFWLKLPAEIPSGTYLLFSNQDLTNNTDTWLQYTYSSATVHYLYTIRRRLAVAYDYNTAPPSVSLSTSWHHIVYSYDTANMRTYLDGKIYDTWPSAGYGTASGNPNRFDIGAQLSAYYATALFDEFLVFTRAWTDQEVYNYYQQYKSALGMGSNY
jgi:hypothetical protein